MPTSVQPKATTSTPTIIGWQGISFLLPPEWNVTGFSAERGDGYLKVDSPGTMFAQLKWSDSRAQRATNLGDLLGRTLRRLRRMPAPEPQPPDLRALLDAFLKQTRKQARKTRAAFDCKIKSETKEANGERIALHFSWSGGGQAQGKIWHCRTCGRVVIAQVVGQARDNVGDVAAQMFGSIRDHGQDGWDVWALYDLVAGIPADFVLKGQKLMSGYLKLEFERRGERIWIERWGLANVTRKKFTLPEWFRQACSLYNYAVEESDTEVQEHPAQRATGRIRGLLAWQRTLRDAVTTLRPATRYDAVCWECPDTNKIYAVQVWHNVRTERLLEEVAARCECH